MKSLSENCLAFTLIAVTIDSIGTEGAEAKISVIKIKKD
tara:strand:+ start:812 stop:928 length:117 start_codon:yes stop_codon:yes gene_type:complete